jgi:hypothetical protein
MLDPPAVRAATEALHDLDLLVPEHVARAVVAAIAANDEVREAIDAAIRTWHETWVFFNYHHGDEPPGDPTDAVLRALTGELQP